MRSLRNAWGVLRREGPYAVLARTVRRVVPYTSTRPSLVAYDDAIEVDWREPHPALSAPATISNEKLTVAWVMSPPGANSGGHQNIYRFMRFLEEAGHEVRVYLYSTFDPHTPEDVRRRVTTSSSYADVAARIERYPEQGLPDDVDVLVCTSWETAYRSYRDTSRARRIYFVQDFEPAFYPTSSESVLAENTYRFGFPGITAGGWLAEKLARDYGMPTESFDFGADSSTYHLTNRGDRRSVFFYARPETPRRGFELGAMALDLFARERPDHEIVLAGQNLSRLDVPFAHRSAGNMQVGDLNALYNRCAAGLVMSLTNMSLLPLELLASGVIPVVNDAENNRLVSDNPFISYAPATPRALADAMLEVVDRPDLAAHAIRASESAAPLDWSASGAQFLAAFERIVRG
ncbi:MAG: glycosyltransferase family 1 protein [Microbacteriaceae bacterium]